MIGVRALHAVLALGIALLMAAAGLPHPAAHANTEFPRYVKLSASDLAQNRPVRLGVNKSVVIELPRPAGDVLVSNPEVADAVLRTADRLYLIGVALGQANVFLFDAAGQQIASFDIYVEPDVSSLNRLLREAIPDGTVSAEAVNGNLVLRGEVGSATAANRAVEIAETMLENGTFWETTAGPGGSTTTGTTVDKRVINLITILGVEQVNLQVTIAEVQREVVKQLGINTQAALFGGEVAFRLLSPTSFPINPNAGSPFEAALSFIRNDKGIESTLRALEETNMMRVLAKPNLTAVSGETANFLAGGEFPIPVASDDRGITIAFKQFGVNLAFTPVVLSPGRISMKVRTEVSDIAATGAFTSGVGTALPISIPGVTVRRAETTVELPSGGAFMVAGLVKEETRRAVSGFPILQKLPILGALFSSKDFLRSETELVILVTPYLVRPTSPQNLKRPDQNLMMADDAQSIFLGQLTRIYGSAGTKPRGHYSGQVGFSFD